MGQGRGGTGRWRMRGEANLGLGILPVVAREQILLAKAGAVAREALQSELVAARKDVKEKGYCWTTHDVARHFEVHPKTVDHWRKRLQLPSKKFGRAVKFQPGDVRRWAAQ